MKKVLVSFTVDMLKKTLGIPDHVLVKCAEYDPLGDRITLYLIGEDLPETEYIPDDPNSLNGMCKNYFSPSD